MNGIISTITNKLTIKIDEYERANRYNHFLNGSIYTMSVLTILICMTLFVCIGMLIGGFIKYFENQCNKQNNHQQLIINNKKLNDYQI